MLFRTLRSALWASIFATLLALVAFGGVKARFTGADPLRSALQTLVVGGIAASAAFFIARMIG
jgi:VIT1/CCC1 family predicted Fe2+/Mn2+ transporter